MPNNNRMSRRLLLGSTLGGLFLAPFLRQRRLEAQNINPKRIILAFTPDSHPPEWWPQSGADPTSFVLQEPLADFEEIREHLLFPRRLDHSWSYDNHHEAGMAQLFTGERFSDEASHYSNGPSVDQVLLDNTEIRGGTPIRSVHLMSAGAGSRDKRSVISYTGPAQPIAATADPQAAYSDIFDGADFGNAAGGPAEEVNTGALDARRRIDNQITEVNLDEIRRIETYLGAKERIKLEAHTEALFELQQQLAGVDVATAMEPAAGGADCGTLEVPRVMRDDRNSDAIVAWAHAQADVMVNALACDRTRVGSYQFAFSGAHHNGMFGLQGAQNNNSWHDNVAHISRTNDSIPFNGGSGTTREAFIFFDRFFSQFVAYFAKQLAAIPEGDGSMLDNTLIYWGVESGTNHSHNPSDMQYLLIGGRNIGFNSGQYLEFDTKSAHQLHTAVLNAFGHEVSGFGIEPNCGILAGIAG
jgi:hypothetical protein